MLRHYSLSHDARSLLRNQATPTNCRSAPALQHLVHVRLTVWTSVNTWDHIDIPPVRSSSCLYRQRRSPVASTNNDDHQLTLPTMNDSLHGVASTLEITSTHTRLNQSTVQPGHRPFCCLSTNDDDHPTDSTNDDDHPAVSLPTTMINQLPLPTTTTTSWLCQHRRPSAVSTFDDYSTSRL